MAEARLEDNGSGLAPTGDGWFVVNVRDAQWLTSEGGERQSTGSECPFESGKAEFRQLGIRLHVLEPGESNGLYHGENTQEDFLVLAGECLLLVEGEERPLRQWDFFHCPPHVPHIFVGQGDEPCVLLMVGARTEGRTLNYPRYETALRHRAGAEETTDSPHEAYAPHPHWRPGRPETWNGLPWVRSTE